MQSRYWPTSKPLLLGYFLIAGINQLFEDRQEGDYVVFVTFERTYVETQLNQCIQFLKQIRLLLMKDFNTEKSETGKR